MYLFKFSLSWMPLNKTGAGFERLVYTDLHGIVAKNKNGSHNLWKSSYQLTPWLVDSSQVIGLGIAMVPLIGFLETIAIGKAFGKNTFQLTSVQPSCFFFHSNQCYQNESGREIVWFILVLWELVLENDSGFRELTWQLKFIYFVTSDITCSQKDPPSLD